MCAQIFKKISERHQCGMGTWEQYKLNKPVNMEAFEQEKNGVLHLSGLASSGVRLHRDQIMLHQRLPYVVKFSSICSVQKKQTKKRKHLLNIKTYCRVELTQSSVMY